MTLDSTVTTVTCTLNAARHVKECLHSVRSQNYRHLQHLIIDGKSTDGTQEIAKTHGVTCLSEPDLGVYDAFRKGTAVAQTDIVHILGADDTYAHENVVLNAVRELANADIVHARIHLLNATGEVIGSVGRDIRSKHDLIKKFRVAHPTMFVRSEVYRRYGSFYNCFSIAGDYDFCLRVWDKVRVRFVDEIWVNMRTGGLSSRKPILSYRECLAAQILHGKPLIPAMSRHVYEVVKRSVFFPSR